MSRSTPTARVAWTLILAVGLAGCSDGKPSDQAGAPPAAPPPDNASRWLLRQCSVGEPDDLPDWPGSEAEAIRGRFSAALLSNVPPELLDQVKASAKARYAWWQELFEEDLMRVCIPAEERDYLEGITESEFIEMAVSDFETSYLANAITGLGIVGRPSQAVRQEVTAISLDRRSPLARSARWTLNRWKN